MQTFVSARDVLCELCEPLYPDAWHGESAYFFAGGSVPLDEVAPICRDFPLPGSVTYP